MRKHSDPLNTPSMEAHWRCVQHLHSCVFALLYSALAHHPPSPQHPKTRCQSPCDAPRQRGFDRSKTFKSLPLSSTAARFNALYQKRPPCSFRASSREVLSAGRFRYNSLHLPPSIVRQRPFCQSSEELQTPRPLSYHSLNRITGGKALLNLTATRWVEASLREAIRSSLEKS